MSKADTIASFLHRKDLDDEIRSYMDQLLRIPLLSGEEEQKLTRRIAEGDEDAKASLLVANLHLVIECAKKYEKYGVSLEDMILDGNAGLRKAVETFHHQPWEEFRAFALWRIEHAIIWTIRYRPMIKAKA